MNAINVTIDGRATQVERGATILEAARGLGIKVPTLCHMKLDELDYENNPGACRICVVEVAGRRNLAPACKTECTDGMDIKTHSARVINARQTVMELLLSNHPNDCLRCVRNQQCELQKIAADLGVREIRYAGEQNHFAKDESLSLVRDKDKCIMCRRCEAACHQIQSVDVLTAVERGFPAVVSTAFNLPINDTTCVNCGQCVAVCPTGALAEKSSTKELLRALGDPTKKVLVQTAPAVRVGLGKDFGFAGKSVTGKMVAALRQLGFDYVFDTDFAADLTIMEEGTELLSRIGKLLKGEEVVMPMMTSCCPGWVTFIEKHFPELLPHLSTAKSPMSMFGAVAKNYFAEKINLDRRDLVTVAVMPCVAKKYERAREEFSKDGDSDTNIVITTRELAALIRFANIEFDKLEDSDFDTPLGESTGAGVIFGNTGGVIEAAIRTAYELHTGKTLDKIDFHELRGFDRIRSAAIDFGGVNINIGIAHGLAHARELVEQVKAGKSPYHAIEVMACPGGCIGGGGQPYHRGDVALLRQRQMALYGEDEGKAKRKSHENEDLKLLYAEFLGAPCGHISHKLLHTHYFNRKK